MDLTWQEGEPILKLALECESLFQTHATAIHHDESQGEALVLSELQQRFSGWAVYLGIFAAPERRLDRKLQRHGEIRQQVLFLLDIIRRNLNYIFLEEARTTDAGKPDSAQPHVSMSIDALEAVEKAIKRFGQVGIAIRRSPSIRQSASIRKYAGSIDSADFEKLAHTALRILYPDATHGLLEHLASSMTETYIVFHRLSSRNKDDQTPQRISAAKGLETISEEPVVMEETSHQLSNQHNLNEGSSKEAQAWVPDPSGVIKTLAPGRFGQSEPTSVDSQEFRRHMRRFSPSATRKTKSILAKRADYPQPSSRGETCDWCFQPFPDGFPQGEEWQRHLHEDHKPYVCISEQCFESLTRFASSAKWLEHMKTRHGPTWTREVHAPTSWICPFCGKGAAVFERPDDLALHLERAHPGILTEPQVQAVVRQSRLHYPRAPDICPLCSFSVSQSQDQKLKSVDQGGRASAATGQTKHATSHHKQATEPSAAGSKAESSTETTTHVATHLQDIMLLSLRLIPAHLRGLDLEDCQSIGSSQYSVSTITRSSQGDLGPEVAGDDGRADESPSSVVSDRGDQEYDHSSQMEPPDDIYEPDWDAIPRPDFQSENDDILAEIGEAIRRKVELEPSFQTLQAHTATVRSLAFSPNGQKLASGSTDDTIKIRNVATGQCLQTWNGHTNSVWSVAFSPNGQQLASGSDDKTINIWSVATGQCLQTWNGHTDTVYSVAFSPNGQQLASGSTDDTIKIWNVATGQCLQTLGGHTSYVSSVAFSPNGQQLASGSWDNTIKIWNVATGQCLQTLDGHTRYVNSVAFSPNGQQLASGSDDKTIKIWNVATGQCLQTLDGHTSHVNSVAFSPNGQQLASGSWDNTIKIWNVATGQCLQTWNGHTYWIRPVAFSPNSQQLASGSDDKTIKIWNVATGQCLQTLNGHTDHVLGVAFSPDGQKLASGSGDQTIRIWDITHLEGGTY
ncbi:hypothetical protein OQA88_8704 [Cercophora sp. LCS_1]